MLALWIILGIILWAIGWGIMYTLQSKRTLYPKMWDNDDRAGASIMACLSWAGVFIWGIYILFINKFTFKFVIKFLKKLEPKNIK